jgi:hypothetical protein
MSPLVNVEHAMPNDARSATCADVTHGGSALIFIRFYFLRDSGTNLSAIDEFPGTGSRGFVRQRAALKIEPLPHPVLMYVAERRTDQASC